VTFPTESEQIATLRVLQNRLWREHMVSSALVIRLGDVVMLSVGTGIEVAGCSGFDAWADGKIVKSDLTEQQAVDLLLDSRPVELRGR
jgi:hypothetical protein